MCLGLAMGPIKSLTSVNISLLGVHVFGGSLRNCLTLLTGSVQGINGPLSLRDGKTPGQLTGLQFFLGTKLFGLITLLSGTLIWVTWLRMISCASQMSVFDLGTYSGSYLSSQRGIRLRRRRRRRALRAGLYKGLTRVLN